MIRKNDLLVTTERYLFLAPNYKGDLAPLWLTMSQVASHLVAGHELTTVGESRKVWGTVHLIPGNR